MAINAAVIILPIAIVRPVCPKDTREIIDKIITPIPPTVNAWIACDCVTNDEMIETPYKTNPNEMAK